MKSNYMSNVVKLFLKQDRVIVVNQGEEYFVFSGYFAIKVDYFTYKNQFNTACGLFRDVENGKAISIRIKEKAVFDTPALPVENYFYAFNDWHYFHETAVIYEHKVKNGKRYSYTNTRLLKSDIGIAFMNCDYLKAFREIGYTSIQADSPHGIFLFRGGMYDFIIMPVRVTDTVKSELVEISDLASAKVQRLTCHC